MPQGTLYTSDLHSSPLEGSTAARHICTITTCLLRSPQDAPVQVLPSTTTFLYCCAWEVTLSLLDTLPVFFVTYLLPYYMVTMINVSRMLTLSQQYTRLRQLSDH